MDPIELAMARGRVLEILRAWMDRDRSTTASSEPTYMVDDLLQTMLARHGYPATRQTLNGSILTYLKDTGAVEYKTSQPAGPKGPTLLLWRITHHGMQLLEGTRQDDGIRVH